MTPRHLFVLGLSLGGLLVRGAPSPGAEDRVLIEHALSMEFETPHTDWAQPYIGGKLRVLCFTFGRETSARWIIELKQRFDVEAEAVYWTRVVDSTQEKWLGGDAGEQRILRLLDEPWDCFIFHQLPLTYLNAEMQYKLLRSVTEGAGLVLVGANDDRVLKPENQLEPRPAFLTEGEAFTVKNGRAVRLPGPPDIPYRLGWEMEYDYWQERFGRAVLWAAGREPEMRLEVNASAPEMARSDLGHQRTTVRWANAPAGPVELEITLRGQRGLRLDLGAEKTGEAAGQTERALPPLPADQYHVDVRALTKKGVAAWATTAFTVTSARTVEAVELDRGWGEVGDEISGRVTLAGEPVAGERLEVRLIDRRGRILAKSDVTDTGGSTRSPQHRFRFPIPAWMPMFVRVEAAILSGQEEVAATHTYFRVTKRNRGQFNFLVWDVPRGTLAPYAEESLARIGMTVQLAGGNPPPYVAAYDVAWVPYTTRILAPHDEHGYMQPVCWNDEPAVDEYVQGIVDQYRGSREHGVFVYSLGDETVTRGSCVHPACLEAYRRYLQQEYGDIAALNESWGTNYAGFADVQLSQPQDDLEAEALRQKNYPRWYDRQAFQCYNFVQFCKRFGDAYRRMDSQARTGFEGAGRFADGDDFDLIVRTNGFWSPYPGPGDEVIRSIAPRGFPRSNWMGYDKEAEPLIRTYWRMVTRGCDAVWWWRWDNISEFQGLLAPHFGQFPALHELLDETQVVRDGLGTLLLESRMQDDGVALLYSHPSAYANRVEGGASYGGYESGHVAWHTAIRNLGLSFRYVTDRMLRQGEFRARRYQVLILPQAEAMGPAEAAAIVQFVQAGGTVLADVRPGLFDGHCKPQARGILDDLFGVQQGENVEAETARVTINGRLRGRALQLTFADAKINPALTVTTGQALGQAGATPVVITRSVGQGQAILLNFSLATFPNLGVPDAPEEAAVFLRDLLATAGVTPRVQLLDERGQRLRNVEVTRWRNGSMEIVALFRHSGEPGRARVVLPDAHHVYDLRQHQYLGRTASFTTHLRPARPNFFALAPQPFGSPHIALPPAKVRPGNIVTATVTMDGPAGGYALRLRATRPDGQPADWLDRVVLVRRGGSQVELPIAHNDPTGTWTLRAIELFTGQTAEVEWEVE